MNEIPLTGGGRTQVVRKGNTVLRHVDPWTESIHSLLRFLENKGFAGSPRIADSGYDKNGREALHFIEGDTGLETFWSDEAIIAIGKMLKELHRISALFIPEPNAEWRPWFGRQLRTDNIVYGHGDFAPWNLISKDGIPIAAIDWENAGPVDRVVELAHVCWLNVQLCDDDVAVRAKLPSFEKRAEQLRLLVDAYDLPLSERQNLVEVMIEVAILDAADQAIEANVTPDLKDPESLWGLAWRTRSAAWMVRNRRQLEEIIK